MSSPVRPEPPPLIRPTIDPADLWESLVDRGVSPEEATQHVTRLIDPQRLAAAQGEREQAQRLLEVSEMGVGERAGEGLAGLGGAVGDIGRGVKQVVTHPIQTAQAIARDPLALVREPVKGILSGDPREIGRGVGNIGSYLLPVAKTSRAAGAPTAGALATRAVAAPARAIGAVLQRPALRNQLIRARIERAQRPSGAPQRPARPQVEHHAGDALDDLAQAQRDFAAGRISQADFATAMEFAGRQMSGAQGAAAAVPPASVIARSLERAPRPRATRVSARPGDRAPAGGTFREAGPTQRAGPDVRVQSKGMPRTRGADMSTARAQIESLSVVELRRAKAMAGGNTELIQLIDREIAKRAKAAGQ